MPFKLVVRQSDDASLGSGRLCRVRARPLSVYCKRIARTRVRGTLGPVSASAEGSESTLNRAVGALVRTVIGASSRAPSERGLDLRRGRR